jgi:carboxypeptidase Q
MSGIKFLVICILICAFLVGGLLKLDKLFDDSESEYLAISDSILTYSLSERIGYKWLGELCNIGPRLSGSEQSLEAIYWAKKKFEEMGCDTVWLQPVMVPKWERGTLENCFISSSKNFKDRKLNIASLGTSIGTDGKLLKANIIEVTEFKKFRDFTAEDVQGKIVFFNEPFDKSILETFRAYGKAVQQRARGAIEASKLGAVAAIVRSVTSKPDNIPHVGTMSAFPDTIKKIPGVAIGVKDAEFLSNLLKDEPEIEVALELDCANMDEVQSYNVIAEVKGSEFPDELVVVGGHFDSWDKGHGAHDDGAPCIQTMEVLHQMIELDLQPKRTVRCVLFINEENGIRGALEYAKYAEKSSQIHVAAIESDRGVFIPQGFNVEGDEELISEISEWLPFLKKSKIDWIRKGGSGVDISKIKNITSKIGFVPDDQRYFDVHHSANDVFESVNAREMQLGTAAISTLTYLISQEGL